MSISLEDIDAEIAKRGFRDEVKKPRESSIGIEDIDSELQKRRLANNAKQAEEARLAEENENPLVKYTRKGLEYGGEQLRKFPEFNKFIQEAAKESDPYNLFFSPLSDAARGAIEGTINTPSFLANLPIHAADWAFNTDLPKAPMADFSRYKLQGRPQEYEEAAPYSEFFGNLLGLPGVAAEKAIAGAYKPVAKAAGNLFGKEKGLFSGYKKAEQIAEQVADTDFSRLLKESEKLYEKPKEILRNAGIRKIDIGKNNAPAFKKNASEEEIELVSKAFATKKYEDILTASQELGRYIHELNVSAKKAKLQPFEKNARTAAKKLKDQMDKGLYSALEKAAGKEGAASLREANRHWGKVAENKYNPLLNKYRAGEILAEDLIPSLYRNKRTKAKFTEHFPETMRDITQHVEVPQRLRSLGKIGAATALGLGVPGAAGLFGYALMNRGR